LRPNHRGWQGKEAFKEPAEINKLVSISSSVSFFGDQSAAFRLFQAGKQDAAAGPKH
jgi:hypothetical protein